MLPMLAESVDMYLSLLQEIRRWPPEQTTLLVEELPGTRENVRRWMVQFGLLPAERLAIGPIDENGDDAEILELARAE